MSAQALALNKTLPANLRPFDIRRDLLAVADLVELCFANSLDADGRLYIRQMRQAARGGRLLDLASAGGADLPLGGMVWVEDGKVVGNLSLIPHHYENKRIYLIANVAVHPSQRGRGIARKLTQAALEEIKRRGALDTWLQVDQDNPTAVKLYRDMGFIERTRRTSWRLLPDRLQANQLDGNTIIRMRRTGDWAQQKDWLEASYPSDLRWHLPLDLGLLQPGLLGSLQRVFSERRAEQWSAERKGKLLGILSWQSSSLESDRLWLASTLQLEEQAIPALISYAHSHRSSGRKLALNYEAGRASEALQNSGFKAARTLIWMDYPWNN